MTIGEVTLKRQAYPAYEDSGVVWLGNVPKHWPVDRVRFRVRRVVEPSKDGRFCVALENVESWTGRYIESDSEYSAVGTAFCKGDILFGKLRPYLAKGYRASQSGSAIGDFFVMRPEVGLDPDFLHHWVLSEHFVRVVDSSTYGTKMPRASWEFVANMPICCPPIEEQYAIADFLDRATAKIDTLIEKKEGLIELLAEKRTAVITQAVTKGLDLSVPMKDSGVEWLGEVPEHWAPVKMRYLTTTTSGGTPDKGNREYWDGSIPWVSPKDMKQRVISGSVDHVSDKAISETGLKVIQPPAVLIVVRGMILAHSFPVALTAMPVTINQDMKALALATDVAPAYFLYQLEGMKTAVLSLIEESGHGTKKLRSDLWFAQVLHLPSAAEQHAIADFLDCETARIDTLTSKVREAIDRLKEYRTALISAAVTGKIDVRDAA